MNRSCLRLSRSAAAAVPWAGPCQAGLRPTRRGAFSSARSLRPRSYFFFHALDDRVQGNGSRRFFRRAAVLAADWVAAARRAGASGVKGAVAKAALWASPLGLAAMILAFAEAETGFLPLGAADPTVRLEGSGDLARDLDARAKAEGAPYVLNQGDALNSLMRFYGDPSIAIVQPEQRIRWIFEPSPPENLFARPGLALAEAGRRYDLVLRMRFRTPLS